MAASAAAVTPASDLLRSSSPLNPSSAQPSPPSPSTSTSTSTSLSLSLSLSAPAPAVMSAITSTGPSTESDIVSDVSMISSAPDSGPSQSQSQESKSTLKRCTPAISSSSAAGQVGAARSKKLTGTWKRPREEDVENSEERQRASRSTSASASTGVQSHTQPQDQDQAQVQGNGMNTDRDVAAEATDNCPFLDLAPEILHRILLFAGQENLRTVSRLSETCRSMKWHIHENPDEALWRELHHYLYDDPRKSVQPRPHPDWKQEVKDRFEVQWVLERVKDGCEEPAIADFIARTLLGLYLDVPPSSSPSRNVVILENILHSQAFENLYRTSFQSTSRYQLRTLGQRNVLAFPHAGLARLHALTGWFTQQAEERALERQMAIQHGVNVCIMTRSSEYLKDLGRFRAITYSIRNFSHFNEYGPFHPDGTVHWQILDAIAAVMDANVTYVKGRSRFRHLPFNRWEMAEWQTAKAPTDQGVDHARGKSLTDISDREREDWADVQGSWRGTYAFMDYTDFIQYNYSTNIALAGIRDQVDIDSYVEAVGNYMKMDLQCGLSERAANLPRIRSQLPESDLLPPLEFCGSSSNGAQVRVSDVRGRVSLTPDNPPQVKWVWVVSYGGEDRWRLEGVQIGGRGSQRGIVGMWSDVERADLSPVGPFWYWPSPQQEEESAAATLAAITSRGGFVLAGMGANDSDDEDEDEDEDEDDDDDDFINEDEELSQADPSELVEEANPVYFVPRSYANANHEQ